MCQSFFMSSVTPGLRGSRNCSHKAKATVLTLSLLATWRTTSTQCILLSVPSLVKWEHWSNPCLCCELRLSDQQQGVWNSPMGLQTTCPLFSWHPPRVRPWAEMSLWHSDMREPPHFLLFPFLWLWSLFLDDSSSTWQKSYSGGNQCFWFLAQLSMLRF